AFAMPLGQIEVVVALAPADAEVVAETANEAVPVGQTGGGGQAGADEDDAFPGGQSLFQGGVALGSGRGGAENFATGFEEVLIQRRRVRDEGDINAVVVGKETAGGANLSAGGAQTLPAVTSFAHAKSGQRDQQALCLAASGTQFADSHGEGRAHGDGGL